MTRRADEIIMPQNKETIALPWYSSLTTLCVKGHWRRSIKRKKKVRIFQASLGQLHKRYLVQHNLSITAVKW